MSRGRGRGRGRGKGVSFAGNLEAIGLAGGESAPPPILQPPSLFPTLNRCPLPLEVLEVTSYLVAIKQELKLSMKQSSFHLKKDSSDSVPVHRYSDKSIFSRGTNGRARSGRIGWDIDWNFFPKELRPGVKSKKRKKKHIPKKANPVKKRKKCVRDFTSSGGGDEFDRGESDNGTKIRKSRRVTFEQDGEEEGKLEKKLENLEKIEQLSGESEQSGGEEIVEEIYEEEEEEEGTDYNLTYFDNGEEFDGGDDDTLEDGPIY